MSVIIPDCPCCKYFVDNKDISKPLTCKAFPNGIPEEYLWGKIDVKCISECCNGYKYETKSELATRLK